MADIEKAVGKSLKQNQKHKCHIPEVNGPLVQGITKDEETLRDPWIVEEDAWREI